MERHRHREAGLVGVFSFARQPKSSGETGMALYRSRSIRQVILIGFSVVTLPLISALIAALVSVDRLTTQSQQAIFAAADTIKSSRMLVEDLTAMERHARQFQVLNDPAIYQVYLERHEQFRRNVQGLLQQDITAPLHGDLETLRVQEYSLFETLQGAVAGSPQAAQAIERFRVLSAMARAILVESGQLVGNEAENMRRAAVETQQLLLWLTLLLILLAFILAAIFTVLITRPLRQINHAIRQLGDGEFAGAIRVSGPDDLENLGKRLEWLRLRLIQLEQEKINFLRHISHELKTPLASIREGAGLLRDQVVGPLHGEQREVVQILQQNSLQLQRLIEDLINFSVAERRAPIMERRPVPLHRLLKRLVHDQKLAAKAKSVAIDLDVAEAAVIGDAEKLRVVFDNLLSNAIKYTPHEGRITLTLREHEGNAVVDVRDEGPGIAPDERERVFEAFYQGRAVAKGHIKGSGLGLSIAREYVELHAGRIEVLDAAKGAHLRVMLPLATQTEPSHGPLETVQT
jgi:two-component system sensor histidine kinase GlrK